MLGRKMLAKNSVNAAESVEGFREIRGGARRRLLLASFREDALRCGRDRAEGGSATTSVRGGQVGLMN